MRSNNHSLTSIVIVFAAAGVMATAVSAGVVNEFQKLVALDGASGDLFGGGVAIDGDVAIVGVRADDDFGNSSGSAYIFRQSAPGVWTQEAKIHASDAFGSDQFGWTVAIENDIAVVNARRDDVGGTNSGSVYVFRMTAPGVWTQVDKLNASDPATNDEFGSSLDISNGVILVGASNNDDAGSNSGSAYFFVEIAPNDWNQLAKVTAPDAAGGDEFGFGVSINGDVAAIGAPYSGGFFGSVYIYRQTAPNVWAFDTEVTTPDADSFGEFGFSVSIKGDRLLVGAPSDTEANTQSGVAYVFARDPMTDTWSQSALFTPPTPTSGMFFGESVDLDFGAGAIGARGASIGMLIREESANSGTWVVHADIEPAGGPAGNFGDSVAIDSGVAIVGAPGALNNAAVQTGAAFLFDAPVASNPADLNGDGVVNGADLAALLTQWNTNGPADFNNDGVVNGADLAILLTNWG